MTDHQSNQSPEDQDAVAEQAMTWFVRLRAESVSPAERMQFHAWHQADPAHREAYAKTASFWDDADFGDALSEATLSPQIQILASPQRSRTYRFSAALLAMAASIILAVNIYRPTLSCWQADYCTAVGEIKTVQLADGSQVTLNSASAISIDMDNDLRHVRLKQGTAFFDVQRDTLHPFEVDAHYSNTRVLGTRFVIKEDNLSDSVTVVSGVVEVSRYQQGATILKANDSITVDAEHSGDIQQVTATAATAWLKGGVMFDNVPLSEVIAEIARYRRGSVIIKNEALKTQRVSGRFDITDTNKALNSLQQTLPIRVYQVTPWLVVIG
jgi:transmembrane sensor